MGLSAKAESSGTCGPNLKWHLTDDGVLTIQEKGKWMIIQFHTTVHHGDTLVLNEL